MSEPPLHYKSAIEIARLIRERKTTASDVLEHFLSRVQRFNPTLNAIVWLDTEGARQRAKEADEAIERGEVWGPLHGVPMTIKESYNVADSPTTWGDPRLRENVTATSALAVGRLKRAGVNLFGKTNVPFLLGDWQSYNEIYGTTNNPWDLSRTPGGSSGGSGVALAAGLTGLDAGSDIGGSIRSPAHYCGVFGLKPTWGIVSPRGQALPGIVAYSDLLVVGPMSRGAEDLDIALSSMAGPDDIDGVAWKLDLPVCHTQSLKDMRIAVKLRDPNSEIDIEYADRLQGLIDELARRGATVKEIEPSIDTQRLHEIYVVMVRAATSGRLAEAEIQRLKTVLEELGSKAPLFLRLMVQGNSLPHRDWLKMNNERHIMRREFNAFFDDWDILLCPAAAAAAFQHDKKGERWQRKIVVNRKEVPTTDQTFWAGYSGVTLLPSTTGPAGLTASGLPVGYQAIGASGRDRTTIAFARHVEREIGGFMPPPGFED